MSRLLGHLTEQKRQKAKGRATSANSKKQCVRRGRSYE